MKITPGAGGLHVYPTTLKGKAKTSTPHVADPASAHAHEEPAKPSTGGAENTEKSKRAGEVMRLRLFGMQFGSVTKNVNADFAQKNPEKMALLQELGAWKDSAPKGAESAYAHMASQLTRAIFSPVALPVDASCKGMTSLPEALFSSHVRSATLSNMQGITHLPKPVADCGLRALTLKDASGLTQTIHTDQFPKMRELSVKGAAQMDYPVTAGSPQLRSLKLGGFTSAKGSLALEKNTALDTLHLYDNPHMSRMPNLPLGVRDISLLGTPISENLPTLLQQPKGGRVNMDYNTLSHGAQHQVSVATSHPHYEGPAIYFGNALVKPKNAAVTAAAQVGKRGADLLKKIKPNGSIFSLRRNLANGVKPTNMDVELAAAKDMTPNLVNQAMPFIHAGDKPLSAEQHQAAHDTWQALSGHADASYFAKFLDDVKPALGKKVGGPELKGRIQNLLSALAANPATADACFGLARLNQSPDNRKNAEGMGHALSAMEDVVKHHTETV
jgi:hypothetical protein